MGSIGGGGRYNDLTGLFGVPNIPGVGISFGVDRIYDVLDELQLFPAEIQINKTVLFFNLGVEESTACLKLMQQLRAHNIACELYHENAKMDKQFKYAEKKQCTYIVIIGSKELTDKTCTIKNIITGTQQAIGFGELTTFAFE
jgi:histidyl-tRNA synthetase